MQTSSLSSENAEISDLNFVEVTINSNKLNQLLEQILKQLNQHQIEIKRFQEVVPTIKKSVAQTIDTAENRIQLGMQTAIRQMERNFETVNEDRKYLQNQILNKNIQLERRIKIYEELTDKLEGKQKNLQSNIKQYAEYQIKSNQKLKQEIEICQETIGKIQKQVTQIDQRFNDQFQALFIKIQSMVTQSNPNKKVQVFDPYSGFSKSSQLRKQDNNKKLTPRTAANWAKFSVKASQLETAIKQKMLRESSPNSPQREPSSVRWQQKSYVRYEIEEQKLKEINKKINQLEKNKQLDAQQISKLKNKIIILEEKSLIQLRKIEKDQFQIGQLAKMLKKISEKKTDQQMVQILSAQVKKNFDEITEELEKKVFKDSFERQKNKLIEKIKIIQENIVQKADKGEIKKAMVFIQEKIKQIILLVANEQNDEKDGAIRKIPVKCLSCDKGLQFQSQPTSRQQSPIKEPRFTSRNIRKRIQMSSRQNLTMNI